MDSLYCGECQDYVEVRPERGRMCSLCNPGNLGDDEMQELDFNEQLFDRIGD